MKNKKINRTLKLMLLLIGVLIVSSCEEDEIQNVRTFRNPNLELNHNHEPNIVTQKLSSSEFPHKREIRNYLSQIASNNQNQAVEIVSKSDGSGSNINPLLGLNIVQDQAEYTTYIGGHTYTFATYRDNPDDSGIIENIVLESDGNGGYHEYLFKYLLDESEYQALQNGLLSEIDLITQIIITKLENGIANVLVSNSDWCYFPSVVIQGCIGCGGPGPCHNSSNMDEWGGCSEIGTQDGPITYITYQWQPCGSTGGGGTVTNPPNPGDLPPAGGGGSATPKPKDPNEGNPGDSGDDPTAEDEPVDEIGGVTKPLVIQKEEVCNQLKNKLSDVPSIKTKLNELLNESIFEKGFKVNKTTSGEYISGDVIENPTNVQNELRITPFPNTVVIAHFHTVSVKYKMFSANDILKMAQMVKAIQSFDNNPIQLTEVTMIVAFNNNDNPADPKTFAIRFDNNSAATKLLNILNDSNKFSDFNRDLKDKYISDNSEYPLYQSTSNIWMQQKHIFNLFEKYDLDMSLYEANFDSNGNVNSWQKVIINEQGDLDKEQCN